MTRAVENLDDLLKIINEVASCTIFELVKRRKREREFHKHKSCYIE
jgi:hypothetical protein